MWQHQNISFAILEISPDFNSSSVISAFGARSKGCGYFSTRRSVPSTTPGSISSVADCLRAGVSLNIAKDLEVRWLDISLGATLSATDFAVKQLIVMDIIAMEYFMFQRLSNSVVGFRN